MDVREAHHSIAHAEPLPIREKNTTTIVKDAVKTSDKAKENAMEALKDIGFGSLAGVAGKFVEYPFDTVKVRLQSQPDQLPLRYSGPVDCFRQSLAQEGFGGIYRGISAPLLGAAIETSSLFFSYRLAQQTLQATLLPSVDPLPLSALVGCGAASGAFTSLLLTPVELVKCKMQVPVPTGRGRLVRPGISHIIASVYRHHGLAGFWHGQMGTLLRETGGSAAWFGGYESVSITFRKLRAKNQKLATNSAADEAPLPVYQQMAAGAVAGMSYNFIFYPADTIKSRMQTEEVGTLSAGQRRKTFMGVGKALWQQHGLKGMYRGCGITVLRSAPSSALIFSIYEWLKKTFN